MVYFGWVHQIYNSKFDINPRLSPPKPPVKPPKPVVKGPYTRIFQVNFWWVHQIYISKSEFLTSKTQKLLVTP